jgi:hypothetical protein
MNLAFLTKSYPSHETAYGNLVLVWKRTKFEEKISEQVGWRESASQFEISVQDDVVLASNINPQPFFLSILPRYKNEAMTEGSTACVLKWSEMDKQKRTCLELAWLCQLVVGEQSATPSPSVMEKLARHASFPTDQSAAAGPLSLDWSIQTRLIPNACG